MVLSNDEEIGKKINSAVFPGLQGGPLMHIIAAKAVAFGEALKPDYKLYIKGVIDNAKALGETLVKGGVALVSGGTDTHVMLRRSAAEEAHRQGRGDRAWPRQHHLQQERRAIRSGEADGHLRHPARLAGRHHARLRHRRVPVRSAA